MFRKLVVFLTFVFLVPSMVLAANGKLRGKVTDKATGEPLIGANVLLEGTTLGAAADINGDYIVLSVTPGVYTVQASFVGYASYTVSNVRISSDLTTTLDMQLTSSAVQVEGVEVVAERPLIQRNTTNTVRMTTQENIENLPIRGVQNIIALEAGVVQQNGVLYVRGGRAGEIAFYLEGANTTNPINNSQSVSVIQEAIEELQLQAGGYTAEFGGGNSAIVRTTLRSGTPDYRFSVDYRTDDFAKPGKSYLGGTSFGFRNAVATFSGPLGADNLKLFVAGQHNYIRDRDVRFLIPFNFDSLRVDTRDARYVPGLPRNQQALLPGSVGFSENYVPNNWFQSNSVQGTIVFDQEPFKVRLSGSYAASQNPVGSAWPGALLNIFRRDRFRESNATTTFGELRLSHIVTSTTFYELGVSYQNISNRIFDPKFDDGGGPAPLPVTVGGQPFVPNFRDNWHLYSDSIASAGIGHTNFRSRWQGPPTWRTIRDFGLFDPGAPNNRYDRSNQSAIGVHADFTSQLSPSFELKAGGRLDFWKARNYTVFNIENAMRFLYGDNGTTPQTFRDMDEFRVRLGQSDLVRINHYGYDVLGNDIDDGPDAPKKPFFASGYVQTKLEYADLIVNVGFRLEHYDTKARTFANPSDFESAIDQNNDIIDDSKLVDADPFSLVLPRVSFSFPVTNNTVFYAMYGKYAQLPALNQLYVGLNNLSRTVSSATRGSAFLTPVGYLMKPERTTQYELGFRQMLTDNLALTLSGFYKDLKDQLAVRFFVDERGSKLFTAYLNEDFGTVKGLEMTLEVRRVNRFAARINYTLSDARGTASNPNSAFGAIEQNIGRPSNFINPLEFNQTHRGTILLDYRFGRNDGGPVLEGLGLNALVTFNSGHGYTKIKEPSELGQANPWNVGIRPLLDPRSSFPVEPINASTTPWVFNVDLNVSKVFWVSDFAIEVYANFLNLFDTKHVLNVYPSTGTPTSDGWLSSPLSLGFRSIPLYSEFYTAINSNNQHQYETATGNRMFGTPRQVRFGVKVEL